MKSDSAFHLPKPTPELLIMFVLTRADQGAEHRRADCFHLEEPGEKKPTSPAQQRGQAVHWEVIVVIQSTWDFLYN